MLPGMNDKRIMRPSVQTGFGGINHNLTAGDGEIWDMGNLCSLDFPLLRTRPPRGVIYLQEGDSPTLLVDPNGSGYVEYGAGQGACFWTDMGRFYLNGEDRGEVAWNDIKKSFAVMGEKIIIFPDKKILDPTYHGSTLQGMEVSASGWCRFGNGQVYGAPAAANTLIFNSDVTDRFRVGDAITIRGEVKDGMPYLPANDKTAIVREIITDQYRVWQDLMVTCTWLRFDENCFELADGDLYDCELVAPLPAGTYHYVYEGTSYQFTTTEELAEGGRIYFKLANVRWVKYIKNNVNTPLGVAQEGDGGTLLTFINAGQPYTGWVTLSRTVPDMDGVFVHENRLWGYKGNKLYASKLGDPLNFNVFDGLDTDSWAAETADLGDFTAGISYRGYPTFFKERGIYKIQGDAPRNYAWTPSYTDNTFGVSLGAARTLVGVGDSLYYLSPVGICAYAGSFPTVISSPLGFGDTGWCYGTAAGTDGFRYFVCLTDSPWSQTYHPWTLYAYDTRYGVWHKEDAVRADSFFYDPPTRALYMVEANSGYVLQVAGEPRAVIEENVGWFAEFADMTRLYETTDTGSQNKKGPLRILLRCSIGSSDGSNITVSVRYDSDSMATGGDWLELARIDGFTQKKTFVIPMLLHRCDHFRLRLDGVGDAVVYSMTVERYGGSQFQGGEELTVIGTPVIS